MDCGAVAGSSDSTLQALEATTMPPTRAVERMRRCLDIFMVTFLSGSIAREGAWGPFRRHCRRLEAHSRAVTGPSQSNARAKLFSWLSTQSRCPRFRIARGDFGRYVLSVRSSSAARFSDAISRNTRDRAFCRRCSALSRLFSDESGRSPMDPTLLSNCATLVSPCRDGTAGGDADQGGTIFQTRPTRSVSGHATGRATRSGPQAARSSSATRVTGSDPVAARARWTADQVDR